MWLFDGEYRHGNVIKLIYSFCKSIYILKNAGEYDLAFFRSSFI